MRVSVAICTWNREALLWQALVQMTMLDIPCGVEWELIVVNNNCTDQTDQVIRSFEGRLPLRRVFEPTPGQSNARNAAVRASTGDYILWTDDDALVDPNWLSAYVEALGRWPRAAFFGGPVAEWFASPPPTWLQRGWPRVRSVFAVLDLGDKPFQIISQDRVPFGANWAVKGEFQRAYTYDQRLGVAPGRNFGGEETAFMRAMLSKGYEAWWVPSARVQHYIPAERMSIAFVRKHYVGYGEHLAASDIAADGPIWFGSPRWLWKQAVVAEGKYRLRRLCCSPEVWVEDLIDASVAWGMLAQLRSLTRRAGTLPVFGRSG